MQSQGQRSQAIEPRSFAKFSSAESTDVARVACSFLEVFFGFDNFFVAYAGNVFKPVEYMAAMLLMVGVISALGSLLLATFCESFRREPEQSSVTLSVLCA